MYLEWPNNIADKLKCGEEGRPFTRVNQAIYIPKEKFLSFIVTFNKLGAPFSVGAETFDLFGCVDSANEHVLRRELDDANEWILIVVGFRAHLK